MNTTWRDIDFANLTIEVSPKKDRQDTWEWCIKDTDRRTLPLTADLVRLLVELQMSQPEGNPYVFVPTGRYELIQDLRRSGQWTVERGRSPPAKFCHHFNKIRARAGIASGTSGTIGNCRCQSTHWRNSLTARKPWHSLGLLPDRSRIPTTAGTTSRTPATSARHLRRPLWKMRA